MANLLPGITRATENLAESLRYKSAQAQQEKARQDALALQRQKADAEQQGRARLGEQFQAALGSSPEASAMYTPEQVSFMRTGLETGTMQPESAFKYIQPSFNDLVTSLGNKALLSNDPDQRSAYLELTKRAYEIKNIADVFPRAFGEAQIRDEFDAKSQARSFEYQSRLKAQPSTGKKDEVSGVTPPKNINVIVDKTYAMIGEKIKKFQAYSSDGWFNKQPSVGETQSLMSKLGSSSPSTSERESKMKEMLFEIKGDVQAKLSDTYGDFYKTMSPVKKEQLESAVVLSLYVNGGNTQVGNKKSLKDISIPFSWTKKDVVGDSLGVNMGSDGFTQDDYDAFQYALTLKPGSKEREEYLNILRKKFPITPIK